MISAPVALTVLRLSTAIHPIGGMRGVVGALNEVAVRARVLRVLLQDLERERGHLHSGLLARETRQVDAHQRQAVPREGLEIVRVRGAERLHLDRVRQLALALRAGPEERLDGREVAPLTCRGRLGRAGRRRRSELGQRGERLVAVVVAPDGPVLVERLAPVGHDEVRGQLLRGEEVLLRVLVHVEVHGGHALDEAPLRLPALGRRHGDAPGRRRLRRSRRGRRAQRRAATLRGTRKDFGAHAGILDNGRGRRIHRDTKTLPGEAVNLWHNGLV